MIRLGAGEPVYGVAGGSPFFCILPRLTGKMRSLTAGPAGPLSQGIYAGALTSGDWAGCRGGQLNLGERRGARSARSRSELGAGGAAGAPIRMRPPEGACYGDPGKSAALRIGRCAHLRGVCMGPEVPLGAGAGRPKGRVSFVGARVNTRAKVASRPVRSPGGRWQCSGDRHHHEGKVVAIA